MGSGSTQPSRRNVWPAWSDARCRTSPRSSCQQQTPDGLDAVPLVLHIEEGCGHHLAPRVRRLCRCRWRALGEQHAVVVLWGHLFQRSGQWAVARPYAASR